MAFTVICGQDAFDAEKTAKDHAIAMFPAFKQKDEVVSGEVRKDDGTVVFSRAGAE